MVLQSSLGRRGSVLIVDDEPEILDLLREILEDEGYQTWTAADGPEGIELYKTSRPDVVLLDVTMPRMDGLRALCEIRRIDPCARVAMLTANGKQTVIKDAIQAGAVDFILKPFDITRVLSAVQELLAA